MLKSSFIAIVFGVALALGSTSAATASTSGCVDDSGLCVDSGDAKWSDGKQSSSKDRRKRSKKNGGTLDVTIEGGRGSVFVNGRFVGTAPVSGVDVPSGKNDLHVRDGAVVLASGLLNVSKSASVAITVRHD